MLVRVERQEQTDIKKWDWGKLNDQESDDSTIATAK